MLKCSECGLDLRKPCKDCPSCGKATQCPSHLVYAAEDAPHLQERIRMLQARHSGNNRKWKKLLGLKRRIAKEMKVSINMQPESLLNLISNSRIRYINLHNNRLAGAITDPDRYKDNKRLAIDTLLFGPDGMSLTFGALSLGGIGLFSYGPVCITLKNEQTLTDLTSFLEENSFHYYQHDPPNVRVEVPAGSRSLWVDTPMLAIVKHQKELEMQQKWSKKMLRGLLLQCVGDKKSDRYLEAQIAAPITQQSIERIVFSPKLFRDYKAGTGIEADLAAHSKNLAESLCTSGKITGINVEVYDDLEQEEEGNGN